jgi:two-component system, chemotaxis family, chemotaxis protein CheY
MALNVLVADDSSVMRSIVIRMLRMIGLQLNEVHQAENGRQALEILDGHWIDLLLVDINMPEMNGIEMINSVRQRPELSDLPIVVISTESSATRIAELKQKGIGFIHKPFSAEILRDVLTQRMGATPDARDSDRSL